MTPEEFIGAAITNLDMTPEAAEALCDMLVGSGYTESDLASWIDAGSEA